MKALVGYTGFVGSNICANIKLDKVYNSKNIKEAYGLQPDLLIYAGVRAEKYLANQSPEKDIALISQAKENIKYIAPKKLILISTIDVFKNPVEVNELSEINCCGLQAYGLHRYYLECWVRENYPNALIIRLPALFGINIKKNFIYDYMNVIPSMLKADKFYELQDKDCSLSQFYELQNNGFYQCKNLNSNERDILKEKFEILGFSALNFTDSRSTYQFYPLKRLWRDIQIALENNILLLHPATEPVSAGELFHFLTGSEFINELGVQPFYYDYKTIYEDIYHGKNGYIYSKIDIMSEIKEFIKNYEVIKNS